MNINPEETLKCSSLPMSLQNLDGACIQSVTVVMDEDPKAEVTMTHGGEVFVAGQYRISLPYLDGNLAPAALALHSRPHARPQSGDGSAGLGDSLSADGLNGTKARRRNVALCGSAGNPLSHADSCYCSSSS